MWTLFVVICLFIYLLNWCRSKLDGVGSPPGGGRQQKHAIDRRLDHASAVSSFQGNRAYMEDTFAHQTALRNDAQIAYYGVFDGHGGHRTSEFARDVFHTLLTKRDYMTKPEQALMSAFEEMDRTWLHQANLHGMDDGSTAIVVLVLNHTLYVANLGDSRAVMSTGGGKAMPLSDDHKPIRPDEKRRIEELGGRVVFFGTWRVEGVLAVSRALGDRRLKPFVSGVPEVQTKRLAVGDEFLILASDGVWDVLSNQEAVDCVLAAPDVQSAASMLSRLSFDRGSQDNITSLVIDLRHYLPGASHKLPPRRQSGVDNGGKLAPSSSSSQPQDDDDDDDSKEQRQSPHSSPQKSAQQSQPSSSLSQQPQPPSSVSSTDDDSVSENAPLLSEDLHRRTAK